VVRTSTYDAASALTGLTFTGTGTPGDLSYHYDSAGGLDRSAGSWARADLPSPVADANFDPANRLTSLDGTTRTYDPEGNLISDGSSTYNWNARGELTATSGAVGEAQIRYDALGRRTGTTVDGATWNLQYDGDNLVAEDGPGAQDSTYLMGPGTDSALARVDGLDGSGGASALLTDRLGSVVARTAPGTSDLAAEYSYGTYGAARSSLAGDTNPIRYTGRESGPGMPRGLQFQRARWYEPGTGRFLSEDPAGFGASGPNLYSYVDGDPVDATDPTGAVPQMVAACAVGGAINTVAGVLLGRKHTAEDYLRGLAKGCVEGALMFGVGKILGVGLRSARGVTKGLDEAAETAAKAATEGDHIVLGLRAHGLEGTAGKMGGRTLLDDPEWMASLQKAIGNPSTKFTVSLDGMSGSSTYSQVMGAAQRGAGSSGGYTDWEMAQLFQAGRLPDVTFLRGGSIVPNPWAP
jgi:RHS repeat-associated protein